MPANDPQERSALLQQVAADCARLGLPAQQQTDSLVLLPPNPALPELRFQLAETTAFGAEGVTWDGRALPALGLNSEAEDAPAAALWLAFCLESWQATEQLPPVPKSPADFAALLLDLERMDAAPFQALIAFLFFISENDKKFSASLSKENKTNGLKLFFHDWRKKAVGADVAETWRMLKLLDWTGFFRLSPQERAESLQHWAAAAEDESCPHPDRADAWADAALCLAAERTGEMALVGPRADRWADRARRAGLSPAFVALPDEKSLLRGSLRSTDDAPRVHALDLPPDSLNVLVIEETEAAVPTPVEYAISRLRKDGICVWLTPQSWWTDAGFGRWRAALLRLFSLRLLASEPPTANTPPALLAVLVRRADQPQNDSLLIRFSRPLAELLPQDGDAQSARRRSDRLRGLWQTAETARNEADFSFHYGGTTVSVRLTPSLRARRPSSRLDASSCVHLLALPDWWLRLTGARPEIWKPPAGLLRIGYGGRRSSEPEELSLLQEPQPDTKTSYERAQAIAPERTYALGPEWPRKPDLRPTADGAELPRTTRRIELSQPAIEPWLMTAAFQALCLSFEQEGLPQPPFVPLPEVWPAVVTDALRQRLEGPEGSESAEALDKAALAFLCGGAEEAESLLREIRADLALRLEPAKPPEARPEPALETFLRENRRLLPPRPFPDAYYEPAGKRDPQEYRALALHKIPRPSGACSLDWFMGQHRLLDAAGRALWQGEDWTAATILWIQTELGAADWLTLPKETATRQRILSRYALQRERARREAERSAFARTRSRRLARQWAEKLLAPHAPAVPASIPSAGAGFPA